MDGKTTIKNKSMRQFKTQFHGGTDKDIFVVNCYVPSAKRRKAMTPKQKKDAKGWARDTLIHVKQFLKSITE